MDGFGRSLQSERPAVTSGYRVVSSQKYNSLGQVAYNSAPYQIAGNLSSGYAAPVWNSVANYHQYAYEELGRVWLDETKASSSALWSDVTIFDAWWHRQYDPNGNRTDTYVDGFGQPAQVTEFNSGGASYNTSYVYDKQGNLTGVTDHLNNSTSIQYNLLGWKTAMTDPDMGTWSYAYDSVGNLQSQTDARGQTLYFKYDDLNRTVEKRQTSSTGTLIADYTFDDTGEKGLLSRSRGYSAAGTSEVQYVAYDARNRLTQQNWVVPGTGGGSFRFDYTYNEADQPTSTRYPGNTIGGQGEAVNYTYNSVGQINAVSSISGTYASSASYNPAGQLTQLAQPGITRQRVYESNTQRLSVVKAGTNSPTWDNRQNLTYSYDNAGNVTSLVDGQNSSQKQCFQYDYLYRLTGAFTGNSGCTAYSATGTGPYNQTYAYNAIGNITSYAGNSYTYGSSKPHAVTAAYGNSYVYDAVGNQITRTISSTAYSLVYDYENRLTQVKQGAAVLASFVYDADGNRVKGTVGITNTVYIAGLYEYSGGVAKSYYTGPGGVVAMRSGGTVYYLLSDHLNSTARIVNSAGAIQDTNYFFPFGGNRGVAFGGLTTKRFTGQYHESSIPGGEGLYYYNARWYDAKLGRFISADSLVPGAGNPQNLNRYAYVYNNPLKYNDPSGHVGIGITGNCMCGGSRYEGSDGFYVGPSASNKQEAYRAFEALPYADTPNDFLVATTGCGYACRAGYEDEVGWGWRLVAGAGIVLPIGYRSVKSVAGLADLARVRNVNSRITVLSGHGFYEGDGWFETPTRVVTYSKIGGEITDKLGNLIESGAIDSPAYNDTYRKVWEAGSRMPNYVLKPPYNPLLNIVGNPITVNAPTKLSELITAGMGTVHWAACTACDGTPWSGLIYGINKVY